MKTKVLANNLISNKGLLVSFLIVSLILFSACSTQTSQNEQVIPTSNVQGEPDGNLDCARGQSNCAYPGSCGQYTDKNQDGFCDHGQ